MADRSLVVWCFGEEAGTLTDAAPGLSFAYSERWVEERRPPLSQALPTSGAFTPVAVEAFFGGLLPEGTPRQTLAHQLGVSAENDFSLLAVLGGDTAGAVSLVPPGTAPAADDARDVTWLSEQDLAEEIRRLPTRPMHVDEHGEFRLSLAGAQDKLPVVVGSDGRVGLTRGGTPSTHIMKTPIPSIPDSVANEALCLEIGRRLGIATVRATPRRVEDTECLLVERYDRQGAAGGVIHRLHQEDFCQALGVPSARKYQAEGGPDLAGCFDLVRSASSVPARDAVRLFDYVVLSFLVGNHDAHGKNYSLVYAPSGTEIAPAYDVLSTFVYRGALRVTRKLAMSIGSEYRPDYVRARHFDDLVRTSGLAPAAARRRAVLLASRSRQVAGEACRAVRAAGWEAAALDRILALVAQRAGWLEEITVTSAPRPPVAGAAVVTEEPRRELTQPVADAAPATTEAVVELSRLTQAIHEALGAGRSGSEAAGELKALVSRFDEAADTVTDALSQLSERIWSVIADLEDGAVPLASLGDMPTLWRQVAAAIRGNVESTAQLADAVHRLLEYRPVFRAFAGALGRLVVSQRTIDEWDARLADLGVPAPTAPPDFEGRFIAGRAPADAAPGH